MKVPRERRPAPATPSRVCELTVCAVGAQGDGVADGPVFVPFTLPGERLIAAVGGERGALRELLQSSEERIAPACPHFGRCGGCALQHWNHRPYLAWKVEQVRQALWRERLETAFAPTYAAPPGARRRIALHARRREGRVALGFKARRAWEVVEVAACPVADPRLVAALPALARFAAPLFEHPKSAPTLHATWTDGGLDVDVTGVEARSGGLGGDARRRLAELAAAGDFARATLSGEVLYQSRRPLVRFGRSAVVLPPGGFLQADAGAEAAMAAFVAEALTGAQRVADLYCGAGAFSFRLAERAAVLALDASDAAVAALRGGLADAPGLKAITAEVRDLDRRPLLAAEMRRLDAVLFDPPRAGALAQAREIAGSALSRAVAVSCNPATFARDARVLVDAGFRLTRVLPVDQFLWSPHIELVGVFER